MAYLTNLLLPITYIHIFLYETNRNRIVNHYGGHTRQLSRHFEIKRDLLLLVALLWRHEI